MSRRREEGMHLYLDDALRVLLFGRHQAGRLGTGLEDGSCQP
jgi:hypothetical protein